eukprot:COSAG06_NODE_22487_length_721_cov_2527.422830_1_plen_69_part_00
MSHRTDDTHCWLSLLAGARRAAGGGGYAPIDAGGARAGAGGAAAGARGGAGARTLGAETPPFFIYVIY